jgi:hypothetical protein
MTGDRAQTPPALLHLAIAKIVDCANSCKIEFRQTAAALTTWDP